jgi:hypothetical protein
VNNTLKAKSKTGAIHIMGAEPAGVTKKVAAGVGRQIKQAFEVNGKRVRLKGMRFIPSTKIELGQGAFQVMANTVVEVAGAKLGEKRAESVDSVVTVDREKSGQVLKAVKIPALERAQAAAR